MEEQSMEEVLSKALTDEEKKLVVDVLSNIPLQGSIQTLPAQMEKIVTIIRKLS